jgi:hypothetical protein
LIYPHFASILINQESTFPSLNTLHLRTTLIILESFKAPKISARLSGGTDYQSWAQEAEAGLETNSVWKYFDADDKEFSEAQKGDKELKEWKVKNKILIATLTLLLERPLQHLV